MSESHIEKITCDRCGKETEFTVYDTISTDDSPEMKEKVREGNLFDWECPECGARATLIYPMLYHQPEDRLMIYMTEPESNEQIEPPEGYTWDYFRNTCSYPAPQRALRILRRRNFSVSR